MVYNLIDSVHKWHLPFGVLKYIFPLQLKHKTIMPSIPVCYTNCHNVNIFHSKNHFMLTNTIILTISGRDGLETSRHLGLAPVTTSVGVTSYIP